MASPYWRRVSSSRCRSFRSLAKVSPRMMAKFLNTWGRTVQQNRCVFGSCHSKAKISCDSGANGIQEKTSFKSNTEYQVLVDSRVASRV